MTIDMRGKVKIALGAKKMNHHPEWSNLYNTVKVKLSTHDAGGVTVYDIRLANIIDHIKASKVKYERGIQK